MALGADLVADDRTRLWVEKGQVLAAPAPNIEGLIEMRGLGLLQADHVSKAAVIAVVDLDLTEADRLPEAYVTQLVGNDLPLLKRIDSPIFAAAPTAISQGGAAHSMREKMATTPKRLVLVTGPSGAGRSTAINVLEDLGFEAIDNLPLRILPRLLEGPDPEQPMALGLDTRNRDFSTAALLELIDGLHARPDVELNVLYLDAAADVLLRRYSETRRKHPMAPEETPDIGIRRELDLLDAIRDRADTLIETSDLNVHQLRDEIERFFAPEDGRKLTVTVQSFSYKRGLPRGMDMVFDCRFLSNPYWVPELRAHDGRDAPVAAHVQGDAMFAPFFDRVLDLTRLLLPAYKAEGKSYLSIAFGCTGGQHRSVALAESLAKALAEDGQQVSIRHRELQGQRKV